MEEVATPKIDVVALLHLPIRRNATPILRFPILNRRKKRPCLASSSRLEEDCTLGRRLLGFAAAAIVAVSSSMCCNSPALAQSLTIAFPVSRALEVTTVQRTLVEAWGLIRETFFDPTFNHQDWDSKLQQTLMQMFPLRSADAAYAKIKAMLSTLGDPFTRIISPKEYQSFRVGSDGNLQGVGLFINSEPRTGRLVVMSCIKSSPADRAGIHKGEELVEINGEKLDGIDSEAAALKLRGRVGTFVTVKLKNVSTMEMKKIACGVLFAAASMTAVMAAEEVGAPAPGPSSAASAALPALGSLVGASLVSLFSYYLH